MRENKDHKNSEYGHFSRSAKDLHRSSISQKQLTIIIIIINKFSENNGLLEVSLDVTCSHQKISIFEILAEKLYVLFIFWLKVFLV